MTLDFKHIGYCYGCNIEAIWSVTRIGDVATGWACNNHLAEVCDHFQRDFEVTELKVELYQKAVEWGQLNTALNKIAGVPGIKFPMPGDPQ